jgi:hypothetical protein
MRYLPSHVVMIGALVTAMTAMHVPVFAAATSDQAASVPTNPEAKKYLDAGIQAMREKQWEKAQASLLLAWRIERHYRIAANLGLVEIELEQYRNAAEHLGYCIRNDVGVSDKSKVVARELFDKARAKVGTIDVRTDAVGATILVDGEVVGHTPIAVIFVEPGQRTIGARMAGKSFEEQSVQVAAGQVLKVVIPEQPPPVQTMPPLRLREQTSDWKTVAVPLGGIVAAAGLGLGIGFTAISQEEGISSSLRSVRLGGAAIGYTLCGSALLVTLFMAFSSTEQPKQKAGLFVSPMVGGAQRGVLVGGAF